MTLDEAKVPHAAFNKMRATMISKGNHKFTSDELVESLKVNCGIKFEKRHITQMVILGLLDKFGCSRSTKYTWHALRDTSDHSEVNPSIYTFIKIFEDAKKRYNEYSKKAYQKRQPETDPQEILKQAIKICKIHGLKVYQEILLVDGSKQNHFF